MKRFITTLVLLTALNTWAQNTIEKNPGDFHTLKVYDLIQVKLVQSDLPKVIISGNQSNDVSILNDGGILKIKMEFEDKFEGSKTNVTLYYTKLNLIDVNEGAYVFSEDIFTQNKLQLKAQEGGVIQLNLNVTEVEVKSVTGGEIETTGKAKNQDISIRTGGIYNGQDLNTESTHVTVQAAGTAHVRASQFVDATIRAGGEILIYGNPEQVNENQVLGGRIKRMD